MIDPDFEVMQVLRKQGLPVELSREATYSVGDVLTTISVVGHRPLGRLPGSRLASKARIIATTTGPDYDAAAEAAGKAHTAVMSLTESASTIFSSVTCISLPSEISAHQPTGAAAIQAVYSMFFRSIT